MGGLLRLGVLDTYGVRWTRETLARDVLQNFFDAAADFAEVAIEIDDETRRVLVRGPSEFDLDFLAYVGATTKKDGTTAGGFGEGFKVCALIALRDFGAGLRAGSGARAFRALLDPVPLGRELCYAEEALAEDTRGSFVELSGCDEALLAAFRAARDRFRHGENPHIGPLVAATADGRVGFARSALGATGEIYYRRQQRGTYPSYYAKPALTLLHDAPIDGLDGDRDRRDLRPEPIAEAIAAALDPEAVRDVLFALEADWAHGSGVLRSVVVAAMRRELRFDFPLGWLARDRDDRGLTALAERQGFRLAAAYLAHVGMRRPRDHFSGDLATRAPTPLELARYRVLRDLYAELAGAPPRIDALEVFSLAGAAVLGQHLGEKVIVGAELLHGEFASAASTVLHELAHEQGGETARGFLRRLETLIAAALHRPELVARAREGFAAAVPLEPEPAPATPAPRPKAYAPEHLHARRFGEKGLLEVHLIAPPAFAPTEVIHAAVDRVAARLGIRARVWCMRVTDDREAHRALAPGVPAVRVGAFDCERGRIDPSERGAFVRRLYDHDGEPRPWPTDAQIEAALRYGQAHKARVGRERRALREAGRLRIYEALAPEVRAALLRWNAWVNDVASVFYASFGMHDLELRDAWGAGFGAAMKMALAALPLGTPKDRLLPEARAIVRAWRAELDARVSAWPPLDLEDDFDAAVSAAALGAALAARARGSLDLANDAYDTVRALADRVLAWPVSFEARDMVLARVLREAGLSSLTSGVAALDVDAARAALARIEPEAIALIEVTEDRGLALRAWYFDPLFPRPPGDARASEDVAARHVARSEAVRAAYHAELERGASAADAARAALAKVLELYPSRDDDARRVARELERMRAHEAGDLEAVWRSA